MAFPKAAMGFARCAGSEAPRPSGAAAAGALVRTSGICLGRACKIGRKVKWIFLKQQPFGVCSQPESAQTVLGIRTEQSVLLELADHAFDVTAAAWELTGKGGRELAGDGDNLQYEVEVYPQREAASDS